MKRIGYGMASLAIIFGLVLSACAAPTPAPAPTPKQPAATSTPTAPGPQLTREQRLIEGAKKEGEVVLWTFSFTDAQILTKAFQDKYPFLKFKYSDFPTGGDAVIIKVLEERKAGRHPVDVIIITSEIGEAAAAGILEDYDFPNVKGWSYQPTGKPYRVLLAALKAIVYNTNLVAPTDVPKSYDDLKSPKWAGKAFASSSAEDTPINWAWLWREGGKLNWDRSFKFWEEVIQISKPRIVSGFTGATDRLAAGEASIFLPGAPAPALRFAWKGAPVAFAPLGKVTGDLVAGGLVKDAPHPNAARLFIDYITSPEGLLLYSNIMAYPVFDPQVAKKARANLTYQSAGLEIDPILPEFLTDENTNKSADFWLKLLKLKS